MPRVALLTLLIVASACSPSAATPSPSATATPAPSATATPTPRPTPSPTVVTTPSPTPIPLPSFAVLSAPSAGVLWALVAGTRLFRSTDRGTTWEERSLPDTPLILNGDIAFVNEREGWISAPGSPASQCQSQAVAVWHTADGATTWERAYQSDFATDVMCKGGLFFADAQRGWMTLFSTGAAPAVWRTADGGKTWTTSSPLPDPPGFTTQPGGFTLRPGRVRAFGTTLLVSATGQTQAGDAWYAFRSTDEGATWKYASTPPRQETQIAFVTATRWLQIVPPDQSSETADGGASWHAFITDYQQAAPIAPQMVFGDANVGYATVRGQIQRTTDGGAHWGAIKTPGT